MARARKGVAKRNRGCKLCKPWRKAGNGGRLETDRRRDPLTLHRHVGHRVALPGGSRGARAADFE